MTYYDYSAQVKQKLIKKKTSNVSHPYLFLMKSEKIKFIKTLRKKVVKTMLIVIRLLLLKNQAMSV